MKKFLFIHGSADAYGSAMILLQINQILVRQCVHPIVILPHHGSFVESLSALGVEVHVINIGVLRRRYFTPWGIIGRLLLWVFSSFRILSLIKKNKVDIIYVNSLNVVVGPILKNFQESCFIGISMKLWNRQLCSTSSSGCFWQVQTS